MRGVKKSERLGLAYGVVGTARLAVYEQGMALRILEAIAGGDTLTEVCKRPDMPSYSTIQKWVTLYPEFSRAYYEARRLRAASFEDEALRLAGELTAKNDFTGTRVRAFEVAMGQYRWSAARGDPAVYGQQQSIVAVVPIQINTSLDLSEGKGEVNTREYPRIYAIEAQVSDGPPQPRLEAPSDPKIVFGDKTKGKIKKRVLKPPSQKGVAPYIPPDPDLSYKLPREENE